MRIEHGPKPVDAQSTPRQMQTTSHSATTAPSETPSGGLSVSIDLESSGELLRIIGDTTRVRAELIAQIKSDMQSGKYLASQAALESASAILDL